MSQHVAISPSEAADRRAIRELVEGLCTLCRSQRRERSDVTLYRRHTLCGLHGRKEPHTVNGIASEGNLNYKNITVAGSGVLASQIAFQTPYKGCHVNAYDISDDVLGHAKDRLTKLKGKLQSRFTRNVATSG